jgi:hypothetical protein
MITKKVSDGLIFFPYSKREVFVLWLVSFFTGNYEKTFNVEAYPQHRRLKILFKNC